MKHLTVLGAGFLLTSWFGMSVAAEEPICNDQETWASCFTRLLNDEDFDQTVVETRRDRAMNIATAADGQTAASTIATNQEFDNGVVGMLLSTASMEDGSLTDLLSRFVGDLGIDGLEETDNGLRLAWTFNPITYGVFGVSVETKEAKLFEDLSMKLGEAGQTEFQQTLTKELGDFDDVEAKLTFSIQRDHEKANIWWGRSISGPDGVTTGYEKLTGVFINDANAKLAAQAEAVSGAFDRVFGGTSTLSSQRVADTDSKVRNRMLADMKTLIEAEQLEFETLQDACAAFNFDAYGKLVANQPQFLLEASGKFRDEAAGRDDVAASIKYEVGQANINGLRRECKGDMTLDCFDRFVASQAGALQKNWRFSIEGKYSWTDAYDFSHPDNDFTLQLAEAESWMAALNAGRSLRLDEQGIEDLRVDIEARYDDVTGDSEKQARFTATATFTQRVSEKLSLAAALVYANRPEFRGEVDQEFSARAGLRVSLKRKKHQQGSST